MLWSRRSIFLGLLLGGPVVLAVILRIVDTLHSSGFRVNGAAVGGSAIFGMMIWLLFIRFIVPVLGVFYGTSLIADEVEDKTITYLFTRPIPRRVGPARKVFCVSRLHGVARAPLGNAGVFPHRSDRRRQYRRGVPGAGRRSRHAGVGLASYGALFALVGTRLKRPLVVGLVFAFGWEPAVLLFPGYLKRLSVAYYLQALVRHEMPQDSSVSVLLQIFHEVPSIAVSLLALAAIVGVALWFSGRAVEQREYILEQ